MRADRRGSGPNGQGPSVVPDSELDIPRPIAPNTMMIKRADVAADGGPLTCMRFPRIDSARQSIAEYGPFQIRPALTQDPDAVGLSQASLKARPSLGMQFLSKDL